MGVHFSVLESDRAELLGSYEEGKSLIGNSENFDRATVRALLFSWSSYNQYARRRHHMCLDTADDLLGEVQKDLASQQYDLDVELYDDREMDIYLKGRIDYAYFSGRGNKKNGFGSSTMEQPMEQVYSGTDKDSVYDLSDRLQVSKGDGLSKCLYDLESEIETAKSCRFLSYGVDMYKVLYVLRSVEEQEYARYDNLDALYLMKNILGYDKEALKLVEEALYKEERLIDLLKVLQMTPDSLSILGRQIGCISVLERALL